MFIEDKDTIDFSIYYKKVLKDRRLYIAYTESEFKLLPEEEQKGCDTLSLKMKELTWGMYNDLQEEAMADTNGSGDRQFNFKIYKENRLLTLLSGWSAKDKDDKPVPINNKAVSHLSPTIAETILRAYDEVSFVTEEKEKN